MTTGRIIQLVAGAMLVARRIATPRRRRRLGLAARRCPGRRRLVPRHARDADVASTVAVTSPHVDLGSRPDTHDWAPLGGELATVQHRGAGRGPVRRDRPHRPTSTATCVASPTTRSRTACSRSGPLELVTTEGAAIAARPGSQPFWVASSGSTLTWDVEPGDWTAVVMRADGTAGIDATVAAGVRIAWLGPLAIALGIAGVAILLAAGDLGDRGRRHGDHRSRRSPPPRPTTVATRCASTPGSTSHSAAGSGWSSGSWRSPTC